MCLWHPDSRAIGATREAPTTRFDVQEAYNVEADRLDGLRKERQYIIDKHGHELQDVEAAYARAKGLPVEQVKQDPSEQAIKELAEWRADIRDRLRRRLADIDAEIAVQAERVRQVQAMNDRLESSEGGGR